MRLRMLRKPGSKCFPIAPAYVSRKRFALGTDEGHQRRVGGD